METISKERLEGVARIYANNAAASRALGPALHSFSRICRRRGVQPPTDGRRRISQAA